MTVKVYLSIDRRRDTRYGDACEARVPTWKMITVTSVRAILERRMGDILEGVDPQVVPSKRMCRIPCCRPMVVPSSALREVRSYRLLRYIAQSARDGALPRDGALHHDELRARRGLVLELSHGKAILRPQANAPAVAAPGSACPRTKGACPHELGRVPQRLRS